MHSNKHTFAWMIPILGENKELVEKRRTGVDQRDWSAPSVSLRQGYSDTVEE